MEDDFDVSLFNQKVSNVDARLNFFLKQLNKLLNSVDFSNFKDETTGIEYSKFASTLSFVLCSLQHIQLKLSGSNVSTHPVSKYLNRIKSYMKQINDLQTKDTGNRNRLDLQAAKRMIQSSTS